MSCQERKPVSVCLGTFNGEKYIERQVHSILKQLLVTDELIVSDDNSTDNTLSILKKIDDKRIKIFINKCSPGIVGNFQNALSKADREYIFLADQDDIWLEGRVNKMYNHLQQVDLVLGNCRVVSQAGEIIHSSFFNHRESRSGFLNNLYKNSYIGCCMAFRKSILSYVLPIPDQVHMHDWWIGLLVELKGRIAFEHSVTLDYIRHASNASPTGEKSNISFLKKVLNRTVLLYYVSLRWLKVFNNKMGRYLRLSFIKNYIGL